VTLLLELGTPRHVVQAIARHADLDVTLSIYAHTNLDAMREALDKIGWEVECECGVHSRLSRGQDLCVSSDDQYQDHGGHCKE
jgi:hypothetical protein